MEIKENQSEEFGEQEEEDLGVTKERKLKRVNLDEDDNLKEVLVGLPKSDIKKLSQEALDKEVSRGSIIRKLVREHLTAKLTQSNPEEIILDDELTELLNFCTTYEGGFQTTGDEGFFVQFANREWKLEDLTDEQYLVLCQYLKVGFDGFFSPPSIEEFMGWIQEIEPSDEQVELANLILTHGVEYTEEDTKKTIEELIAEIKTLIGTTLESSENWKNVPVKE